MPAKGTFSIYLKMLALAAAGIGLWGCHDPGAQAPQVRFVIPNHFTGVIKIMGAPDGESTETHDGVIPIRVPRSGTVTLRSMRVFSVWHTERAVFENNAILPIGQFQPPGSTKIAFFNLWSDANGQRYWLVGTKAECDRLWKQGRID